MTPVHPVSHDSSLTTVVRSSCKYCGDPIPSGKRPHAQYCDEGCRRNYWRAQESRALAGQIAKLTQTERVLRQLERIGRVTPVDFAAPNVCDGGKPIMRVAARVGELRDRGHEITTVRLPNGVAQYRLASGDVDQSDHGKTEEATPQGCPSTTVVLTGAPAGDPSRVAPLAGITPLPALSPAGSGSLFDPDAFASRSAHYEQDAA